MYDLVRKVSLCMLCKRETIRLSLSKVVLKLVPKSHVCRNNDHVLVRVAGLAAGSHLQSRRAKQPVRCGRADAP